MNIKSAVFGLICVKPQTINSVIKRLPYSSDSIYNVIEDMLKDGKIVKIKADGEIRLDIPKDYKNQKLKEFFIKSLSYGVDPEIILRENTILVWKTLDLVDNVNGLTQKTKLSEKSVRKFLKVLSGYGLVKFEKRKPIIVVKVKDHPLNMLLDAMSKETDINDRIYTPGSIPFEEIITTPDEIEKILYEKIDDSLTIKRTGFMVKGRKDKIAILESVATKQNLEEIFINKFMTPEGVEDICIRILAYENINYDALLQLAVKKNLVNQIGCYLDIINDVKKGIVSNEAVKKFHKNISNRKYIFLKDEAKYGKSGWEEKYETKWNVDLYLDIGAIEHGVRAL